MMEPIKFNIISKSNANKAPKRPSAENGSGGGSGSGDDKDYVTGFSEKGHLLSVAPKQTRDGPYVIPLAVQGHSKRSKSSTTAQPMDSISETQPSPSSSSSSSTPATAPPATAPPPASDAPKSLDQMAIEAIIKDARDEANVVESVRTVPLTVQNQIEGMEDITDEDERFKFDLQSRPDEANEEEYEGMPIDEFGFAMLRGMGWSPGSQIGLNNRGLVEPIEFVKRPGYRLGLGATPKDLPVKKKKYIKPGESRDPPPIMVAPTGPDGKVRHVKSISEKLVPLKKAGFQPGQLVGIVSGPHEGLYARVVTETEDDEVAVRLESSSEDLVVSKSDVSIVDLSLLSEGHPALKFMIKEKKDRERERDERAEKDTDSYQKKDSKTSSSKSKSSSSSSSTSSSSSSSSSSSASWIRPSIMVRVVSKSFHNGKYYNKKVRIYDVVSSHECTVQLDNGSLVEGVKQRMLETVIPPTGGKVMVVEGENKGKIGKVIELLRNKKGDLEKAIVQMMGDLNIETLLVDDVAQYVGTYDDETVDISI